MTKLEALMERARTLPPEEQDALAEDMEAWLDAEAFPDDAKSDAELAERVRAWEANPVVIPAAELHARLKFQREKK